MGIEVKTIHVVGGGLAGTECALQLAHLGHEVILHEMRRSNNMTPAHRTQNLAELVCSNSFGNQSDESAPGILKQEAGMLGSFVLKAAQMHAVPAGQALGMDRDLFAAQLTQWVEEHPRIQISAKTIQSLDELPRPAVVATGPLTADGLSQSLQAHFGNDFLYFYDAIAPIIDADSIDHSVVWRANRWNKGTAESAAQGDYLNCPMNKDQYLEFVAQIKQARKIEPKEFEKTKYFESCLPIEVLVKRGDNTPRFGCMSPKGLDDPRTDRWPYAVVQLRQDNKAGTAYNMVGFQTKMAYPEQQRVFRLIPGLENAEFLKLGSIHRNLYINSPEKLNPDLSSKSDPLLFFAGQITGVEGYFESTCMGLLTARFLHDKLQGKKQNPPPRESALGSLLYAITQETERDFQPTNINFGLLPPWPERIRNKKEKREKMLNLARKEFASWFNLGADQRNMPNNTVEPPAGPPTSSKLENSSAGIS